MPSKSVTLEEACCPKASEWRKDPRFHSLPGISDPPSCWVSSHLSVSLTLSERPGPLPSPATRHSARHSGLRGDWLAPTPDLRLPSQSLALPLIGSVPLSLCASFLIGAFLSISQVSSISLSLSVSVSPPWFLIVFLSPSTALSVSLHLCLSPSLSLPSSDGGWVRVGPGQPGQGAGRRGEQYPIHAGLRCHGNAPAPPSPPQPRVPRGCHGYVRRVPASPRALGWPRPAGGAQLQPLP